MINDYTWEAYLDATSPLDRAEFDACRCDGTAGAPTFELCEWCEAEEAEEAAAEAAEVAAASHAAYEATLMAE